MSNGRRPLVGAFGASSSALFLAKDAKAQRTQREEKKRVL